MRTLSKFGLHTAIAMFCLGNVATAAFLDLTSNATISSLTKLVGGNFEGGASGTLDGVGFTIISTPIGLNFNQSYDGANSNPGCQAGGGDLRCQTDGAGILGGTDNDEIDGKGQRELLTITFDQAMRFDSIDFLDLYKKDENGGVDKERAVVTFDGGVTLVKEATHAKTGIYNGGYARLELAGLVAKELVFSAPIWDTLFNDDGDNDYSLAAITASAISPVPVPAAVWLFGTALIGFIGMSRRTRVS